ncbi:hypothetical protein HMPREF1292_00357 [Corynebacterium sp. KPL1995]|nr:hypothetical protein HMPREF1292_00357 [Corynebacterium sp. KPL1995]ERS75292.1 hypothetical protein HMPREF1290_00359 [Corynebacterium sp. KPL1989]
MFEWEYALKIWGSNLEVSRQSDVEVLFSQFTGLYSMILALPQSNIAQYSVQALSIDSIFVLHNRRDGE